MSAAPAAVSMLGLQAAPRRRNRTEQLLVGLIMALTLWGIVMQVMVRSYVRQVRCHRHHRRRHHGRRRHRLLHHLLLHHRLHHHLLLHHHLHLLSQERSLTDGDEERLAQEIASIENELVQQFTPQQLDVWAAEADAEDERGALPGVADAADPNVPNANGEFTVSQTQLGRLAHTDSGPDVLLASRLLFPVVDGDWCELKMTRAIAPGSYQLAMTGVLGRWGAQAAAGLLMLQVRMAGDWSPLLGAPRARAEDLEAPLRHNFSVSHRFDGIRVLATTWRTFNSGGRLSLYRLGSPITEQEATPQKRSRYLLFEAERGLAVAQLSLFNGVALGMLLNVTVVLPRFHTFFTERGEQRRLGDASAAVDMDFYYDVDAFISALAPMVSIVRRLPPALEAFARDEAVQEVDFLNPLLRSRELQRLAEHFHQHNALRLRSPARAVVWNTPRPHSHRYPHSHPHPHAHPHPNPNPDSTPNPNPNPNQVWNTPRLARLRVLLHSALQPSPSTVKLPPWQCPSSAPAPPQGAPGGSGRLETPRARGRATGRPATALGARASRLQSHQFYCL